MNYIIELMYTETVRSCTINQGWASVLFKRTQHSCVLFRSLLKNGTFFAFFSILYRTERFLRSFSFFIKEQNVLCVLFCSLKKNGTFVAFFYVL